MCCIPGDDDPMLHAATTFPILTPSPSLHKRMPHVLQCIHLDFMFRMCWLFSPLLLLLWLAVSRYVGVGASVFSLHFFLAISSCVTTYSLQHTSPSPNFSLQYCCKSIFYLALWLTLLMLAPIVTSISWGELQRQHIQLQRWLHIVSVFDKLTLVDDYLVRCNLMYKRWHAREVSQ